MSQPTVDSAQQNAATDVSGASRVHVRLIDRGPQPLPIDVTSVESVSELFLQVAHTFGLNRGEGRLLDLRVVPRERLPLSPADLNDFFNDPAGLIDGFLPFPNPSIGLVRGAAIVGRILPAEGDFLSFPFCNLCGY